MYKIGVIGDRATVAGFIALGYTVYEVEDPADAAEILHRIANELPIRHLITLCKFYNVSADAVLGIGRKGHLPHRAV